MSEGQVKRDVVISLKLLAAEENARAAATVQAQMKAASKGQADEYAAGLRKQQAERDKALQAEVSTLKKELAEARKTFEQRSREWEKTQQKQVADTQKAADQKQLEEERVFKARAKLLARIAKDEEKARQEAAKAAEKAADEKLKAEQRIEKERQKEAEKSARAAEKAARDAAKAEEKRARDQEQADKRVAAEFSKAESVRFQSYQKLGQATKQVMEGTLTLARGFAYLGLVGEEDTKKIIDGLVGIQAGFDIVKGSIDVFFAIAESIGAVRKALLAATVAQEAFNVAQAMGGAGSVGKGAAKSAGRGVLGSMLGWLGGSALGAAGTGGAGWLFGGGGGAASAGGGGAVGAGGVGAGLGAAAAYTGAAAVGAGVGELGSMGLNKLGYNSALFGWTNVNDNKGTIGTSIEAFNLWRQNSAMSKRLTAGRAALDDRKQQQAAQNQQITQQGSFDAARLADLSAQASSRDRFELSGRSDLSEAQRQQEANRREQLRAVAEVDQARAAVAEAEARRLERQKNQQAALIADEMVAAERLKAATQAQLQAEQNGIDILRQQNEERKRAVEISQDQVKATKAAYEAAKEQTASRSASFGRLGKGEQARLAEIASRYEQGKTLSKADIDTLEKTGFGGQIVQQHYQKQGEAAGSLGVLNALGERDQEAEAFNEYQRAQSELERNRMVLTAGLEQETQAREKITTSMEAFSKALERAAEVLARVQGLDGSPAPAAAGAGPGGPSVAAGDISAGQLDVAAEVNRSTAAMRDAIVSQHQTIRRTQERQAAASNFV